MSDHSSVPPSSSSDPSALRPDVAATLTLLGARWGWFVGLGALLLLLGMVGAGYVLVATLASVVFVGSLMVVAGVLQLVQAWRMAGWSAFIIWTLAGLCYLAAGALALYNPLAGAAALTLLMGAVLIASGAFRLWVWFGHRAQAGWGWLAFSGLITLAAGLLIAIGWPANSLWLLGLLLVIDLVFQGATLIMLGLALRRRHTGAGPLG